MENIDSCPLCHSKLSEEAAEKVRVFLSETFTDLDNLDEKKKLHHESMKKGECIICGGDIFAMGEKK
ncbi:MAG: hypothetical protein KGH55_02145 [Nanoarchaeota archaeon]|nr:hypothetical protein [Nanoarchaeota archaeon]